MKCPNCGYYNMPGAAACGECERSIEPLAAVGPVPVADFYPPRARQRNTAARIEHRLGRRGRLARQIATDLGARGAVVATRTRTRTTAKWKGLRHGLAPSNLTATLSQILPPLASLAPGMGQFIQRRWVLGAAHASVMFLLVMSFLAFLHSPVSDLVYYAILGLMCYSIFDAATYAFPRFEESEHTGGLSMLRRVRCGLVAVSMVSCLVFSTYAVIGQFYDLWYLNSDLAAPTLRAGDGLIVERVSRIQGIHRGDLVLFESANAYQIPVVERVIGVAGDTVAYGRSGLSVNGKALTGTMLPLTYQQPQQTASLTVPHQRICLWQFINYNREAPTNGQTNYLVVADLASLQGRIAGIYQPPARRRWLRR
jgi:signal peptidase I